MFSEKNSFPYTVKAIHKKNSRRRSLPSNNANTHAVSEMKIFVIFAISVIRKHNWPTKHDEFLNERTSYKNVEDHSGKKCANLIFKQD